MKVDLCLAELEKMKSTQTTDAPENTFTSQLKTDLEEVTFKGHHKVTKNSVGSPGPEQLSCSIK